MGLFNALASFVKSEILFIQRIASKHSSDDGTCATITAAQLFKNMEKDISADFEKSPNEKIVNTITEI